MSTIKTCEEYVLRELENIQRESKVLKADKQFLEEQYDKIEKENKRLKEFIKKLTSEAEFDTCSDGKQLLYTLIYMDGMKTIEN